MRAREFLKYALGEFSNGNDGGEASDVLVVNDSNGYAYEVSQVSREKGFLTVTIHPDDWIGTEHQKKTLYAVILMVEEGGAEVPKRVFGPVCKPEAEQIEATIEGIILARGDAKMLNGSVNPYTRMRALTVQLDVIGWLDDDTISDVMSNVAKEMEFQK